MIMISKLFDKFMISNELKNKINMNNENMKKKKENNKNKLSHKILIKPNHSLFLRGIYDQIIRKILNGTLTNEFLKVFGKNYVRIQYYKKNRMFPRSSKTAYTKWYNKGYGAACAIKKILIAILNDEVDGLDKNKKSRSQKIRILVEE